MRDNEGKKGRLEICTLLGLVSAISKQKSRKKKKEKGKSGVLVSPHVEARISRWDQSVQRRDEKKKVKMQMYREPPEYRIGMRGKVRR